MPRRAFMNDLNDACGDDRLPRLFNVRKGDDDGDINFTYISTDLVEGMEVHVLVPDVSDYPDNHQYMLFTSSAKVPPQITTALDNAQSQLGGYSVSQMLEQVSKIVDNALNPEHDPMEVDDDFDVESIGGVDDGYDTDTFVGDLEDDRVLSPKPRLAKQPQKRSASNSKQENRMRKDLKAAKLAGFKVGVLGDITQGGFACISCRVVKLGISEEAMQAWGLRRDHYLVLLIRYGDGYQNIQQISNDQGAQSRTEMRVGLSTTYKPSLQDVIRAFSQVPKKSYQAQSQASGTKQERKTSRATTFEGLFIGGPLNDLLNNRMGKIINYRLSCAFTWAGAELFFNDFQGRSPDTASIGDDKYCVEEVPTSSSALPKLVTADHIAEGSFLETLSFPLVAMQFLLRHFVRCTEFCLICHCKIDAEFEALKPYVCSKPLCLYQYMSLGFGPSVEWEVIAQPYVVDLLVSFCYISARSGRLNDFPQGIGLQVPPATESIPLTTSNYGMAHLLQQPGSSLATTNETQAQKPSPIEAKLDRSRMELLFASVKEPCPVKNGDWIMVASKADGHFHCRVEETCMWPTVSLGPALSRSASNTNSQVPAGPRDAGQTTPAPTPPPSTPNDVKFYVYNQSFDDLSAAHKRGCIASLLETLPDVSSMKAHLLGDDQGHEPSLSRWRDRISKAALDILRWIIASNRSCIIQVDRFGDDIDKKALGISEERVHGLSDQWMQFKFAQGAPDKEQRFMNAVNEAKPKIRNNHPTLFAWHGSPLQNWHGIVREGLHYKETLHGRAYGNGVYMSSAYQTSLSYASMSPAGGTSWPQSRLKVSSAISLNEVVNLTAEFVSKNPHYVVSQLDWIQTRYLFVKCESTDRPLITSIPPSKVYHQDPQFVATGESGAAIVIPITAVSKCRRPSVSVSSKVEGTKKAKVASRTDQETAERIEDDAASIVTDEEDVRVLCSEEEGSNQSLSSIARLKEAGKKAVKGPPRTDFVPGTLDPTTLPLLQPPSYATTSATKTLQRELKTILTVQDATPTYELGWYIDRNLIENMYQWIIEFHSFDATLPLAKDLKAHGLKSIVMELRFTSQFPFSPPFVRVIRPRFLPVHLGGGGHVTAGGALCMELLTSSGWSAVSSIEGVLLQVRMAMTSLDPAPARLQTSNGVSTSYSTYEAIDAYKRACAVHGWEVPKDFDRFYGS